MICELKDREKAAPLFGDWQETLIWSCLQGIMGKIYVDDMNKPNSAMAILGDFCYFAGKPLKELVEYKPEHLEQDFIIMGIQSKEWADCIQEVYGDRAKRVSRYAFKKQGTKFDVEQLEQVVAGLKPEYELRMIDEKLYKKCLEEQWSRDFVKQYDDYEMYARLGIGVLILEDGIPVAGASSYSSFDGGVEIEIVTKEGYRRQGLAYVNAAKLILECLNRGWYPSWDAQNLWSSALAQKLGYEYVGPYTSYEVTPW